jgi:hypothetical protein
MQIYMFTYIYMCIYVFICNIYIYTFVRTIHVYMTTYMQLHTSACFPCLSFNIFWLIGEGSQGPHGYLSMCQWETLKQIVSVESCLVRVYIWLVVLPILKNISQWEDYPIYYGK